MDRDALAARGMDVIGKVVYPRQLRRLRDRDITNPAAADRLWDELVDQLVRTVADCEEADAFLPFLLRNCCVAFPRTVRWYFAKGKGRNSAGDSAADPPARDRGPAETVELADAAHYLRKWARPGDFEMLIETPSDAARAAGVRVQVMWRKQQRAAARLREFALRGGLF